MSTRYNDLDLPRLTQPETTSRAPQPPRTTEKMKVHICRSTARTDCDIHHFLVTTATQCHSTLTIRTKIQRDNDPHQPGHSEGTVPSKTAKAKSAMAHHSAMMSAMKTQQHGQHPAQKMIYFIVLKLSHCINNAMQFDHVF